MIGKAFDLVTFLLAAVAYGDRAVPAQHPRARVTYYGRPAQDRRRSHRRTA